MLRLCNGEYSDMIKHMKVDDAFNYSLYKQLDPSLKYKRYELRSTYTGYVTNIGSYDRQYPYKETDFYHFDEFLFTTWRDKPKGRGKDEIPWGVEVRYKSGFHQKFAVIDGQIVWYGSVNFLSFGTAEESIMRFTSHGIAGQLMDTVL